MVFFVVQAPRRALPGMKTEEQRTQNYHSPLPCDGRTTGSELVRTIIGLYAKNHFCQTDRITAPCRVILMLFYFMKSGFAALWHIVTHLSPWLRRDGCMSHEVLKFLDTLFSILFRDLYQYVRLVSRRFFRGEML